MSTTNIFKITPKLQNDNISNLKKYIISIIQTSLGIEPRVELRPHDERSFIVAVQPKMQSSLPSFQQYMMIKNTLVNEGLLS